jgi:hypothetical protein
VFVAGPRAWATVHQTEARCIRSVTLAPAGGHPTTATGRRPTVTGGESSGGSWRAHTLRVAGCGAWRHMHDRMHRRHR